MQQIPDISPPSRAAGLVWLLLLRHWQKLDGYSTAAIAKIADMTWEGAWSFMNSLALPGPAVLPIIQRRDLPNKPWVCNYWPCDLSPVTVSTSAQRAALVAHRLIVRKILLGESGWTTIEISHLLGIPRRLTANILGRVGGIGGVPLYKDGGKWMLDTRRFDDVSLPYKHDIPQVGNGTLYC